MISQSEKQTINSARKFAAKLKGGEVICLTGDLGTGKTVWVKGMAQALGIKQIITSPSFVLLKRYQVKTPTASKRGIKWLIHIDLYRLDLETKKKQKELIENLGLEEFLGQPEYVTVIEWGEKIKALLPPKTICINFEHLTKEKRRIITKHPTSPPAKARLRRTAGRQYSTSIEILSTNF